MADEWCPDCKPAQACGGGHLYVLELHPPESEVQSPNPRYTGYVYVGSTGKTVAQRFCDNFTLEDGRVVSKDKAATMSEDSEWKYAGAGPKKIRNRFWRFRPDLLKKPNPHDRKEGKPDLLIRREAKLADHLRNKGWKVYGPKRDKSDQKSLVAKD